MKVTGNLYRIKSPAAKAYLWLLVRQEELARRTKVSTEAEKRKWQFRISDADLAQALGVSQTTVENYRKELERLGLVTVERKSKGKKKEIRIKSVKY